MFFKGVLLYADYQPNGIFFEKSQKNIWRSKLIVLIFASAFTSRCSLNEVEKRDFPKRKLVEKSEEKLLWIEIMFLSLLSAKTEDE